MFTNGTFCVIAVCQPIRAESKVAPQTASMVWRRYRSKEGVGALHFHYGTRQVYKDGETR